MLSYLSRKRYSSSWYGPPNLLRSADKYLIIIASVGLITSRKPPMCAKYVTFRPILSRRDREYFHSERGWETGILRSSSESSDSVRSLGRLVYCQKTNSSLQNRLMKTMYGWDHLAVILPQMLPYLQRLCFETSDTWIHSDCGYHHMELVVLLLKFNFDQS